MCSICPRIRGHLDRVGVLLSGLCLLHCVLGVVLVAGMGLGGTFLLDPSIHRVGLLLATVIAAIAIGFGLMRHRKIGPTLVASIGLALMAGALIAGHGTYEVVLTSAGVLLVAAGHFLNMRAQ